MIENACLKRWRIRVFAACFIAYTAAYVCRVNISIGLPGIQEEFGFSGAGVGLVGTAFFWAYAAGQLVNGYLGDKVSGRAFVFVGLIVSALLNALFGFSSLLIVMILLWGANGIFQSMLWGPIVKTLSRWFPVKKSATVSFGMSVTMIAGYLMAWGFSGAVMKSCGWRWAFWLPAAVVLALTFVWLAMARNRPEDAGLPALAGEDNPAPEAAAGPGEKGLTLLWKLVRGTNLLLVAAAGTAQGIVKDGITLWSPKLLMDTQGFSLDSAIGVVLVIPVVNFLGILFAGWLNRLLKSGEKVTIAAMMGLSVLVSLGLMLFSRVNAALSVFLIACASAFMFGANPLMTTTIPMQYRRHNKVSAVAGFIDCSIYIGSGLAGVSTGFIVDRFGWNSVFALWCAVSALGTLAMGWSALRERRMHGLGPR